MEKWFRNQLRKIMRHNGYERNWLTTKVCYSKDVQMWTPCDLIAREYLNNGCGSAKGFLGIAPKTAYKCYEYMCENKQELIAMDMVGEEGYNNFGFTLWKDYNFDL